jgi:hypothetical protein
MKTTLIIALIFIVVLCAWLYTGRWTANYRERNITFHVSGVVLDASSKRPLNNVEVRVWCRDAVTSEHKLRGKSLPSTNYVVNTYADGAFSVQCSGGSIFLGFSHEGFSKETSWSYRNRDSRTDIATNLVIELTPIR